MDIFQIYVLNLLVTIGLLVATLYRVIIEKKQIECLIQELKTKEKMEKLRMIIESEKDLIISMKPEEYLDFLKELVK